MGKFKVITVHKLWWSRKRIAEEVEKRLLKTFR